MNIGDLINRAARLHATRPAVTCDGRSFAAAAIGQRATRLANVLLGSGLEPGARVGVLLPNRVEYMEIEFACALAGLVRVSLNARLPDRDLLAALEATGASALVHSPLHARVAERFEATGHARILLDVGDEPGPGLEYEAQLQRASSRRPTRSLPTEPLYCVFSTSGTTGRPKGVMITHDAQLAVASNLLLEFGPVRPGDSILLPQPLSHGGGFFMLPYFLSGGHCVITSSFDPTVLFEKAERFDVGTLKLVPTMLVEMLRAGVAPTKKYAPRRIIYGAAPMPRRALVEAIDVFGLVFAQLYGQAEAPMCITVLSESDHEDEALLGSAGRPYRTVDVRVVDDAGVDVEAGEHGEVIVRGAHTMQGYWGNPLETAEVMRDGYVHTRDTATIDDRGYVFLLGRTDEMINSGGFNIAPRIVENVLHEHPGILEAAVVGVEDGTWGQAVQAFVVPRAGAVLSPEEIIEYCRPRLGMQRPRDVQVVSELSKDAHGKVRKDVLRAGTELPPR